MFAGIADEAVGAFVALAALDAAAAEHMGVALHAVIRVRAGVAFIAVIAYAVVYAVSTAQAFFAQLLLGLAHEAAPAVSAVGFVIHAVLAPAALVAPVVGAHITRAAVLAVRLIPAVGV